VSTGFVLIYILCKNIYVGINFQVFNIVLPEVNADYDWIL